MAKCPKCGKEIKELNNIQEVYHSYPMRIIKKGKNKGKVVYERPPRTWMGTFNTWACPECDDDLFTNELEAIKFLKGGK